MTPIQYLRAMNSDKTHGKFMALSKLFLHERATEPFQKVVLQVMQMTVMPPVMVDSHADAEQLTRHPLRPGAVFVKDQI